MNNPVSLAATDILPPGLDSAQHCLEGKTILCLNGDSLLSMADFNPFHTFTREDSRTLERHDMMEVLVRTTECVEGFLDGRYTAIACHLNIELVLAVWQSIVAHDIVILHEERRLEKRSLEKENGGKGVWEKPSVEVQKLTGNWSPFYIAS